MYLFWSGLPVGEVVRYASIFQNSHGVCLDGSFQVPNGEHFVAEVFTLFVRQVLQMGARGCPRLAARHGFSLLHDPLKLPLWFSFWLSLCFLAFNVFNKQFATFFVLFCIREIIISCYLQFLSCHLISYGTQVYSS